MGHPVPIQMAWSAAGWFLATTAGAESLYPKSIFRAVPTVVRSSVATPNEAADMATWLTKYPTSAAERSMNWWTEYMEASPS